MEPVQLSEGDVLLVRLAELPAAELLSAWESLSVVFAERAVNAPSTLTSASSGGASVDGRLEALMATRHEFERAAEVAQRVSRRADAVAHLVAGAHHEVVMAYDKLSAEAIADTCAYPVEAGEFAAAALGASLATSTAAARRMADVARGVRRRHPGLLAASASGESTMRVAGLLADELDHLDDEDTLRVESVLLAGGVHRRSHQAARERCRAILRQMGLPRPVDPVAAERERGVWFEPHLDFDTLCRMTAVLDVHDAAALEAVIGERTRQLWENSVSGRGGPKGPLRADALVDLVLENSSVTATLNLTVPIGATGTSCFPDFARQGVVGEHYAPNPLGRGASPPLAALTDPPLADARLSASSTGRSHGAWGPATAPKNSFIDSSMRPSETVAVASSHALFANDGSRVLTASAASAALGDCVVPGVGVISAPVMAAIAATAGTGFTATLTSQTNGRVTTLATTTHAYRPTVGIAKLVRERDGQCRFPYCTASAARCDLDHVVPFDQGGPTTATNLQALCRHHHRAKTHGGFRVTMSEDGTCEWAAPTGRTWITYPGGLTECADTTQAA